MEAVDLVTNYIKDLKDAIVYLVSGIVFMAGAIAAFFFVYRKEKSISDKRFAEMHKEMIGVMREEVAAKHDIKNALENNTKVIERFPDVIINAIKLALK